MSLGGFENGIGSFVKKAGIAQSSKEFTSQVEKLFPESHNGERGNF